MLISRNWLQKYIDLPEDLTPDVIRRQISRCVAEVEGYEIQGEYFEHMVVGQIKKLTKHSNADSLQLCQVDIGDSKKVQIVCGGSNLEKDMFVAVALPEAQVKWHGEGDYIKLKKTVIRGEESYGMICASNEIGLGEEYPGKGKEILDMSLVGTKLVAGTSLADVLHQTDIIFEIENKTLSNRPDLWGHYGIAREFAAVFGLDLKEYDAPDFTPGTKQFKVDIEDYNDCTRFTGVRIDNIKIEPSPDWLRIALESVGVRSINNIVDITNYVMLDVGHPLHAFDAQTLKGDSLQVRRAKNNEKLLLLDDTELALTEDCLVVADDKHAVALAGIMGGKDTEVTDSTTSLFVECAHFNPGLIRKTSTQLGIRTDASQRFEKSLDPYGPEKALRKAVALIQELLPEAEITSNYVDVHDVLPEPIIIDVRYEKIKKVLGTDLLTADFIKEKLSILGFEIIQQDDTGIEVKVPSWRATKDITLVEDVAEEILRMFGYDAIAAQEPRAVINVPVPNKHHEIVGYVKDFCSLALGMNEVFTYSFVSQGTIEALGRNSDEYLKLENPIAQDTPFVRQTLLGNLLESTAKNLRFYNHFGLYEIGRVFFDKPGEFTVDTQGKEMLPAQPHRLTGVFVPQANDVPFYDAKHALVSVLDYLHISYNIGAIVDAELEEWMHPKRSVYVEVLNEKIGVISELHPTVAKTFGIKKRVGIFDIDFDTVVKLANIHSKYKPISKYPSVTFDVSMVVESQVQWQAIKDIIYEVEKELVVDVELFDVFINDELKEDNKKSLAFRITYQSDQKTLEQDEVQMVHAGIVSELVKVLKAEVRK